ncbi:MAG: Bug family tripartite tricarboxylate transporter substrate binding protein [Beijerinckiaceae bacterium]
MSMTLFSRRALGAVLVTSAALAATASLAQNFPDRPVKLIVPYAAGGGTDAIARLIAHGVSEALGQNMNVENNGTAGGNVASQQAAAAAPDGYTVLMANQGPMVVNPHLFKSVKVDPLTAFDPVTLIATAPLVVVVPANSPHKSIQALIEFGKKNPGKLTYGSAGNGSASHLATLLLQKMAGFQSVHVPYRGAGPALNDLVGGRADYMVTTLPSVVGLIEGKQVNALAVTTKARAKKLPDVPTIAESGLAEYDTGAWYGFVVPKGTPSAVVTKLRDATLAAMKSATLGPRLEQEGAVMVGNSPDEFRSFMAVESKRWADVVKEANLSIN